MEKKDEKILAAYEESEPKTYPKGTRYVRLEFKEMPDRVDLEIMYRIIDRYLLADISYTDEAEMVDEDLMKPTSTYYFVVRDCYYLREAMAAMHMMIRASFNSSVRSAPFKEQAECIKAKEEAKKKAAERKAQVATEKEVRKECVSDIESKIRILQKIRDELDETGKDDVK